MANNTENIKFFLEKITGSELSLKKASKTEEDFNRELFEQIIIAIEQVNNRSMLMEADFEISHFKYDESFHNIIEALIVLHFGDEAMNVIYFYLYDRINPDGTINSLYNEDNILIPMNNPMDLWIALEEMKKPKSKRSKK